MVVREKVPKAFGRGRTRARDKKMSQRPAAWARWVFSGTQREENMFCGDPQDTPGPTRNMEKVLTERRLS